MRISVNLANRPFIELRPLFAKLRLAMAVLGLLAVLLGFALHSLNAKARVAQAQMDALKVKTQRYQHERMVNEARMRQPQNMAVLDRSQFLNAVFARKSFSWTAVMMDLEKVLPVGVQVTSIEPVITKEGDVNIHGVAFDITELKSAEEALAEERNVLSAILDTVGALVAVLDPEGRIVRFNRACEQATGYLFAEVEGKPLCDVLPVPDEAGHFRPALRDVLLGAPVQDYESYLRARNGSRRLISWSTTILPGAQGQPRYIIATGIDIMERKRLEQAVLEISNSEQRRIGQDLHDGLGQHLTGIAFMSKALEQKMAARSLPEASDASRIVQLVNEGIHKTRELARGLLPVPSDSLGLMSALQHWASEVEDLFRISCRFICDDTVLVHNPSATNHLYRIAQEAVHNAIRHGRAQNITMYLCGQNGRGVLSIEDDGSGIKDGDAGHSGMGLGIMRYRAGMIGGTLEIGRGARTGVVVTCFFPNCAEEI